MRFPPTLASLQLTLRKSHPITSYTHDTNPEVRRKFFQTSGFWSLFCPPTEEKLSPLVDRRRLEATRL